MSKLIRHTKKRATALFAALLLTALTALLSLVSFVGGPQQSRDGGTPADTQVNVAQDQTQTAQVRTAVDLTAADKAALRKSAVAAKQLYEPLASQVFNLATARAAQANNPDPDAPNDATLTTDRQDYSLYTYVYFTG